MDDRFIDKERLLSAGFGLLQSCPGIDRAEWAQAMIDDYADIVDDVYGLDLDTPSTLEDVWDCDDYEDPITGICLRISEWAEFFAGEHATFVYSELRSKLKS